MSIARTAGLFYLLTFITGVAAFLLGSSAVVANGIAGASYVVVTVLFYILFRPVNPAVSLIAAVFSLVGCVVGGLNAAHLTLISINPLPFFGVYCLLIGFLICRSGFLPTTIGVLMMFAGVSWLTFAWPSLAHTLSPYNLLPGIIGEGALTVWLLTMRVVPPPRAARV